MSLGLRPSSVVGQAERNLKTRVLDAVEYVLLLATGALLFGVLAGVATDVISRQIGSPVRWIQEATMISFVWLIFIGASAAIRRGEHFSLVSGKIESYRKRLSLELLNAAASIVVGLVILIHGYFYFENQMHNRLPITGFPLAVMAAALPVFGAFLTAFTVERVAKGFRGGFKQEEASDEGVHIALKGRVEV